MLTITGTYECKADAKGRLMMPSALKKQLTSVLQEGFVVKRSMYDPCLELYPLKEWDELMSKTRKKINPFKKEHNDFIRRLTAGVKIIEIDSVGRILIPKDLCVYAGIDKEIVLTSLVNVIEIWDKEKYEKGLENSSDFDFGDLAKEVIGNFNVDELS